MPFVSKAQQRWAHTKSGTEALGGTSKVQHWNKLTKYSNLPERVGPPPTPMADMFKDVVSKRLK